MNLPHTNGNLKISEVNADILRVVFKRNKTNSPNLNTNDRSTTINTLEIFKVIQKFAPKKHKRNTNCFHSSLSFHLSALHNSNQKKDWKRGNNSYKRLSKNPLELLFRLNQPLYFDERRSTNFPPMSFFAIFILSLPRRSP